MITNTSAKIVEFISKHKRVQPHDLVTVLRLSRVAIHKQLKKLVKECKLQKVGKPPAVFYAQAAETMNLWEIKKKALPILKKALVRKASVFGSYARGDQNKDSDVDMLVDFPANTTLIGVVRLKRNLEQELKRKVDIVSFNGIDSRLRKSILSSRFPII